MTTITLEVSEAVALAFREGAQRSGLSEAEYFTELVEVVTLAETEGVNLPSEVQEDWRGKPND
jgi:hypothetical protein